MLFQTFAASVLLSIAIGQRTDCPPANICFAIDESSSIGSSDFTTQNNAINGIVDAFNALAPGSSYAAAGFSTISQQIIALTSNIATFKNSISSNSQSGGNTASGAGLQKCEELLQTAVGPRVIILTSDGEDNTKPFGKNVVQDIKDDGITIVAVGIGDNVNEDDLKEIASSAGLFVPVDDFDQLAGKINDIAQAACPSVTPTPSPTPSPSTSPAASLTPTATPSATPTATPSTTPTATLSATPTATPTSSGTPTPTMSPSASVSQSPAASSTPTSTPTASPSPSSSPPLSPLPLPSITPSTSPSTTPSATPTPSTSAMASLAPSPQPKKCAIIHCSQCSDSIKCYVSSGSLVFDQFVCKSFCYSPSNFCKPHGYTQCGQSCGCLQRSNIQCYPGVRFQNCPLRGPLVPRDPRTCVHYPGISHGLTLRSSKYGRWGRKRSKHGRRKNSHGSRSWRSKRYRSKRGSWKRKYSKRHGAWRRGSSKHRGTWKRGYSKRRGSWRRGYPKRRRRHGGHYGNGNSRRGGSGHGHSGPGYFVPSLPGKLYGKKNASYKVCEVNGVVSIECASFGCYGPGCHHRSCYSGQCPW